MNILIVSQYFWPEDFRINELAKFLSINHKVYVLTGYPNYPSGKIYDEFKKNKQVYYTFLKNVKMRNICLYISNLLH